MNIIERLRPAACPLDAEWSAATLESIFAANPAPSSGRRNTRRWLAVASAATAATLGLGGVAYATGLVPGTITDFFDNTSTAEVSNVHEVASFTTADDGSVRSFEIWRGTDADGLSCTAVLETAAKGGPDFGGNCGDYPTDAWFNTTNESWSGTIDDAPPSSTYYVYGEPVQPNVTDVLVVGERFEHSVAVDAATGGYAVAIPELSGDVTGEFATVEFLDASGSVVATRVLSEK